MNTELGTEKSIVWRLIRAVLRFELTRSARRVLSDRTLRTMSGQNVRWLQREIRDFVSAIEPTAVDLRKHAKTIHSLNVRNRLMVELAIYTIAGYKNLSASGVEIDCAKEVTADIGWHVYRRLLIAYAFPVRLVTRNPTKRLYWTIGLLLRFPFSANEPFGYAVKAWSDHENLYTHFFRCPPHSAVRSISNGEADAEILDAFYRSWCQYDWPGADLIINDGERDHYCRTRTLSRGDSVCDMCWSVDRLDCQQRETPS